MAATMDENCALQNALKATPDSNQDSDNTVLSDSERFYQHVEFQCWFCGASSYHLKLCSTCQTAKYCNQDCQVNDWNDHRKDCKKDRFTQADYHKGGSFVEVCQEDFEAESPEVVFIGLDKCPKNGKNNHSGFIGVHDISLDHLPAVLRRNDVLEYIKAESKLTVRVKVKFTSPSRPDSDACAKHRGTRFARTASGLSILDNPDLFKSKPCTVPKCHRARDLGPDHMIYEGDLKIFTNKHVVFDNEELAKTTVDFFYDSEDKKGMVQEYAVNLFYLNGVSDKAFIKVTIHDQDMFKLLYDLDWERAERFRAIPTSVINAWAPNAILLSHPHGMPKKISIGKIYEITDENRTEETLRNAKEAGDLQRKWFSSFTHEDYFNFMKFIGTQPLPAHKMYYDTPSCPGSSGGQVLFGGTELAGLKSPFVANHNGYDLDSSLNFFKCVKFLN